MSCTFLRYGCFLVLISLFSACTNQKGDTLFERLSEDDTQVTFVNELSDSPEFNVMKYGYFYNGGGVAAADFNNDGFTDLYFTGNIVPDRLYIHKGGEEIEFEDKTAKAGLGRSQGWKTGVSVVDINSDGWMDLYVCRSAAETPAMRANLLYINNGDLTFTESAEKYGLADRGYSTQAVFFDYDRDNDLDCFILNHSVQRYAGFSQQLAALKKTDDPYYGSRLMRNDQGVFTDVSKEAGMISNVLSFGLGVAASDLNGDGWIDLYVSNDYNEEDYLYINQQNGTFAEQVRDATSYTSLFSMGCDAADVNNDGRMDIVTLDMLPKGNTRIKMTSGDDNYEKFLNLVNSGFHRQFMRNMLQLNGGNQNNVLTQHGQSIPQFQEMGQLAGISNTDWSWSALLADMDLDGQKDLYITNGYEKDYTNMDFLNYTVSLQTRVQSQQEKLDELAVIGKMPSIRESNYMFQNKGHAQFANVTQDWGLQEIGVAAGAVYADLDHDGDLELIVNNLNAPASIFRNHAVEMSGKSLSIALKAQNSASLHGARVDVYADSLVQTQEYMPVRGFQSSSAGPLIFGLGSAGNVDSIKVSWADGTTDIFRGPFAKNMLELRQKGERQLTEAKSDPVSHFQIADAPYTYIQDPLNDFKFQPLLPTMLSQTGPRTAINKDHTLMYVTGTAKKPGELFQMTSGKLAPVKPAFKPQPVPADEADAVFTDLNNDGEEELVVVFSSYQGDLSSQVPMVYSRQNGVYRHAPSYMNNAPGVCASTVVPWDYNLDGFKDLFIGSRVMPGQYPEGGKSLILTNSGKGSLEIRESSHFWDAGMVTDAVVADIVGDASSELILARDFGSLAYLKPGKTGSPVSSLTEISLTGCWNTVTAADLNGDGKADIIGGNLGLNHQLAVETDDGLAMYSGLYYGISKAIPVVAIQEGGKWYPFAARDEMLAQIPVLKKTYSDYSTYSTATIEEIFGKELANAQKWTAQTFQTQVLLNNGKGFQSITLPLEAQYSTVFAISTGDFTGDGQTDLLLGGNQTRNRVRIGDVNSSFGTLLTGKGNGRFSYAGELGLKGEIRSITKLDSKSDFPLFIGLQNSTSKWVYYRK